MNNKINELLFIFEKYAALDYPPRMYEAGMKVIKDAEKYFEDNKRKKLYIGKIKTDLSGWSGLSIIERKRISREDWEQTLKEDWLEEIELRISRKGDMKFLGIAGQKSAFGLKGFGMCIILDATDIESRAFLSSTLAHELGHISQIILSSILDIDEPGFTYPPGLGRMTHPKEEKLYNPYGDLIKIEEKFKLINEKFIESGMNLQEFVENNPKLFRNKTEKKKFIELAWPLNHEDRRIETHPLAMGYVQEYLDWKEVEPELSIKEFIEGKIISRPVIESMIRIFQQKGIL
jgi:hypothetical protein